MQFRSILFRDQTCELRVPNHQSTSRTKHAKSRVLRERTKSVNSCFQAYRINLKYGTQIPSIHVTQNLRIQNPKPSLDIKHMTCESRAFLSSIKRVTSQSPVNSVSFRSKLFSRAWLPIGHLLQLVSEISVKKRSV